LNGKIASSQTIVIRTFICAKGIPGALKTN